MERAANRTIPDVRMLMKFRKSVLNFRETKMFFPQLDEFADLRVEKSKAGTAETDALDVVVGERTVCVLVEFLARRALTAH